MRGKGLEMGCYDGGKGRSSIILLNIWSLLMLLWLEEIFRGIGQMGWPKVEQIESWFLWSGLILGLVVPNIFLIGIYLTVA